MCDPNGSWSEKTAWFVYIISSVVSVRRKRKEFHAEGVLCCLLERVGVESFRTTTELPPTSPSSPTDKEKPIPCVPCGVCQICPRLWIIHA